MEVEKKKCAYKDCEKEGTSLACGRDRSWQGSDLISHPLPDFYCDAHAGAVEDEGCPEYTVVCPNCSCRFGVN